MKTDEWGVCFTPDMQMSPEQFKQTFCRVCRNGGCVRSAVAGTKWQQRIDTQVDRLLVHPKFGDPKDPQYARVAQVDFPSALREAIRLEISEQKGDWTVPSAEDALKMIQKPFQAPSQNEVPVEALYSQTVAGDTPGKNYKVQLLSLSGETLWKCDCPAFTHGKTNPCKHILFVQPRYAEAEAAKSAPPEALPPPTLPQEPLRQGNAPVQQIQATRPADRVLHQRVPVVDEWAAPTRKKPVQNLVPVGARIVIGEKK